MCTYRRSLIQCQACPLRSSHLSLRPIGHKTSTSFDLIFSDVWALAPMFSSDGLSYFYRTLARAPRHGDPLREQGFHVEVFVL